MSNRAADAPVDAISAKTMARTVRHGMNSRYKRGMLAAACVVGMSSHLTSEPEREAYIEDALRALPTTADGELPSDYAWGFLQMMEILHGSLKNISGPELLTPPQS
jgi:hypothetical protein